MRFSILDLLRWTSVAAALVLIFKFIPPLPALLLCIPLVTIYFAITRMADVQHNNWFAMLGCVVGITGGVLAGIFTDLGMVYLQYRPDLPEQPFKTFFGAVIGSVSGAFVGAVAGGLAGFIVRRRRPSAPR
jgi:hypothetical protein